MKNLIVALLLPLTLVGCNRPTHAEEDIEYITAMRKMGYICKVERGYKDGVPYESKTCELEHPKNNERLEK